MKMDEDPLAHVPLEDRVEIASFERESEALLAAGLLRANGIAAELGTPTVPGLTWQQALWVGAADAGVARQLLQGKSGHGFQIVE